MLFYPQLKDIQFSVIENERKRSSHSRSWRLFAIYDLKLLINLIFDSLLINRCSQRPNCVIPASHHAHGTKRVFLRSLLCEMMHLFLGFFLQHNHKIISLSLRIWSVGSENIWKAWLSHLSSLKLAEGGARSWEIYFFWLYAPLSSFPGADEASDTVSSLSSVHPWTINRYAVTY